MPKEVWLWDLVQPQVAWKNLEFDLEKGRLDADLSKILKACLKNGSDLLFYPQDRPGGFSLFPFSFDIYIALTVVS